MAQVRQSVSLNDKEVRDAVIERAKEAINGKADGPNIPGGVTVEFHQDDKAVSAVVHFERPGATR